MIKYYQDIMTGDFLAVDTSTRNYYKRIGKKELEARAVAIEKLPSSMCTTGVSTAYLKNTCRRVTAEAVPNSYKNYF